MKNARTAGRNRISGLKRLLTPTVEAIHTVVPGRARYRVVGMRGMPAIASLLEQGLRREPGVKAASANPLTGNLLVFFASGIAAEEIRLVIVRVAAGLPLEQTSDPPERAGSNGRRSPDARDRRLPFGRRDSGNRRPPPRPAVPWHVQDAEAVTQALNTSAEAGLSRETAHRRLEIYGRNLLRESLPPSDLAILLEQFKSLPVALLAASAGVSLLTGGLADALVIMGVVALNAAIGYGTESQSERILSSLTGPIRPTATVIREGVEDSLSAEQVVIGDILALKPGWYIAADARLLQTDRLSVDESVLTGESLPSSKNPAPLQDPRAPLGERRNMVFMGTLVTGGQGRAVVVATGEHTEMGRIQALVGDTEAPETPLERQLSTIGRRLVWGTALVCGTVFGIGLLRGYGWLQMLKTSISLAVAAVPEGLPTVATTTLALGVIRMRERRVVVRRLNAVETLGCVRTICLDKTGTLTANRMSVVALATGRRRYAVEDDRILPDGEDGESLRHQELRRLLQACVLCSEAEPVMEGGGQVLQGSPTETALLRLAVAAGMDIAEMRAAYPVVKMRPRAENRNSMSTLHLSSEGGRILFIKGNPAEVLPRCRRQLRDGRIDLLDETDLARIETENEKLAGQALRVLGVAFSQDDRDGGLELEDDLIWLGLVGMADPVRKGVKGVIRGFHRAGIDTIMITGDQSPTAYAIGRSLDLSHREPLKILDSTHLTELSPEALQALADKVHIFARVSPAHKLQIVQALQRSGRVVAMTGDGINDGPALKAADIGVAMGKAGTDVAREVGDVVLEDDDLSAMLAAIDQGRTIYTNIRKSVRYLLATNLSEILIMVLGVSAGLGQPLNPMQLLWLNLVSDVAPALALALEPSEPGVLRRPPRDPATPIIDRADFTRIALEGAGIAGGGLAVYGYGLRRYGQGPAASTLCFMSCAFGQLLHAMSARSETHRVLGAEGLARNPYLTAALSLSLPLQVLTVAIPSLRGFLGLTSLTGTDIMAVGASAIGPFLFNELTKPGARAAARK